MPPRDVDETLVEEDEGEKGKGESKEEKTAKKGKGRKKRELITIKKTWTGRGGMAAAMQKYEEELRKEEEKEKEKHSEKERSKDKKKASDKSVASSQVASVLSRYPTDQILGKYDFPSYVRKIVLIQRLFRRRLKEKRERQERMSCKIIDELIETEETYVKALQTLIDTFHAPLISLSKQKYPIVSPDEVKMIFSEIVVIQLYNQNFLADLCQRKAIQEGTPWLGRKYGDIIDNITQFLRSYTAYYNNYHSALTCLSKCSERPKFKEWLDKQEALVNEALTSLLIRPIQRVPKYVLLLRDLLKNTPPSHPDFPALRDAEKNMAVIARDLNERMKDSEVFMEVLRINSQLSPPYKELVQPHRRFIREGPIMYRSSERSKPKPMWIILFNDILLITQVPSNSIFNRADRLYKLDVVLLLERATAVVPLADRSGDDGLRSDESLHNREHYAEKRTEENGRRRLLICLFLVTLSNMHLSLILQRNRSCFSRQMRKRRMDGSTPLQNICKKRKRKLDRFQFAKGKEKLQISRIIFGSMTKVNTRTKVVVCTFVDYCNFVINLRRERFL